MEITEKSNLKTKMLVIILIAMLIAAISSICFASEGKTMKDMKLNQKVFFEGKTYWNNTGTRERKSYEGEELGCGIIGMIFKNKEAGVYVIGEGFIKPEQVKDMSKYITLTFDKESLKEGKLGTTLLVDGEFLKIDSANEAIIAPTESGLKVNGEGTTTVTIIKKDGTEIPAIVNVTSGSVELSIQEKMVSGEVISMTNIGENIEIDVNAEGGAALEINEEGIGLAGAAQGNVIANYKEEEIARFDADVQGNIIATKDLEVVANIESNQTLTIKEKLQAKLHEKLDVAANKERADAAVAGDVEVNGEQLMDGEASIGGVYGQDPDASLRVGVKGQDLINKQGKLPIVSTLKNLLAKIKK